MKKRGKICLVAALALLLALSTVAQAEMYVEGFLGGNTAANLGGASFHQSDVEQPPNGDNGPTGPIESFLNFQSNGATAPAVVGGARIGTWFVPTGFLGYAYPDWMKYLGFYTDISYHKLNVNRQSVRVDDFNDAGVFQGSFPGEFYSEGYVFTWAFMFAGRYGFFPDSEVPFGRLQPFVGVGPAILFTAMKPQAIAYNNGAVGGYANPNRDFAVVPALAVDAGVRYMALKNVSIDLTFRYRYAQPNFQFNFTDINGNPSSLNFSPTYNLFSGILGVAYHF